MSIFTEAGRAGASSTRSSRCPRPTSARRSLDGPVDGNIRYALQHRVDRAASSDDCDARRAGRLTASASARRRSTSSTTPRWSASCAAPRSSPGWRRRIRSSCRPLGRSRPTSRAPTFDATRPRRSRPSTARRWRPTRSARASAEKLVAAGFLRRRPALPAIANSKGNFGYQHGDQPRLHLHRAHRRRPRLGLGRRATCSDVAPVRREARHPHGDRARRSGSADAKALEPGKYTVILEPAAAAGLICVHDVQLRRAPGRRGPQLPVQEGRRQPGSARRSFDERVNIYADPVGPGRARCCPGTRTACRASARRSSTKGVVKNLDYSRYWAKKQGQARRSASPAT